MTSTTCSCSPVSSLFCFISFMFHLCSVYLNVVSQPRSILNLHPIEAQAVMRGTRVFLSISSLLTRVQSLTFGAHIHMQFVNLSSMTSLEDLHITNLHGISDGCINTVRSLPSLRSLTIEKMTNERLIQLVAKTSLSAPSPLIFPSSLPSTLTSLDIGIGLESMSPGIRLSHFTALTHLRLDATRYHSPQKNFFSATFIETAPILSSLIIEFMYNKEYDDQQWFVNIVDMIAASLQLRLASFTIVVVTDNPLIRDDVEAYCERIKELNASIVVGMQLRIQE